MISVDEGLVSIIVYITDPWYSLTCIDELLKHMLVTRNKQKAVSTLQSKLLFDPHRLFYTQGVMFSI